MSTRQINLKEDTVFRLMRILNKNPDTTQRALASQLGLSVAGLNYSLKMLMKKGFIKMKNFAKSKNKFGYAYVLTPKGIMEKAFLTQRFIQRKMQEYEALKIEIRDVTIEAERLTASETVK